MPVVVERGFARTGYGRIHYRAAGEHGPALLMLHQTPHSSRSYEHLLPVLGAHRRVIAMDTPGYGDSEVPARPFSVADYANAAAALLAELGIDRTAVFGMHTGASIGAELAASHPDLVQAYVALG